MNCIYCGKELQPDNVYCPHCGKAAQIVPDYSLYDDDYLKEVLTQENTKGKTAGGSPDDVGRRKAVEPGEQSQQKPKSQDKEHQATISGSQNRVSPQHKKEQKKKKMKVIAAIVGTGFVLIFAILVLCAAIRSNHNNSFEYQMNLAQKASLEGNLDKALTYYQRAVELDPGSADAKMALADIYMKKKDYDAAEPLYRAIISGDKKNRNAFKNLIVIYEQEDKTENVLALSVMADDSLSDLFEDYRTAEPVFSIQSGSFQTPQTLRLSSPDGNPIYYTMDGSDPITKGVRYSSPIQLSENNRIYTIKAVCRNEKNINSEVVTKSYRIEIQAPNMPTVSPDGGNFDTSASVTISVSSGCIAYYTWDGSTPNTGSSRYYGPIEVPEGNNVLSVIAYNSSTGQSSQVYRSNFIYYPKAASEEEQEPDEPEGEPAQSQEEEAVRE